MPERHTRYTTASIYGEEKCAPSILAHIPFLPYARGVVPVLPRGKHPTPYIPYLPQYSLCRQALYRLQRTRIEEPEACAQTLKTPPETSAKTHLQLNGAPQFLHVHGDNHFDLVADFPQGSDSRLVGALYLRDRVYDSLCCPRPPNYCPDGSRRWRFREERRSRQSRGVADEKQRRDDARGKVVST